MFDVRQVHDGIARSPASADVAAAASVLLHILCRRRPDLMVFLTCRGLADMAGCDVVRASTAADLLVSLGAMERGLVLHDGSSAMHEFTQEEMVEGRESGFLVHPRTGDEIHCFHAGELVPNASLSTFWKVSPGLAGQWQAAQQEAAATMGGIVTIGGLKALIKDMKDSDCVLVANRELGGFDGATTVAVARVVASLGSDHGMNGRFAVTKGTDGMLALIIR